MNAPVQPLLLAAGRSARFGADKRLHRLPGGDTLLARSVRVWVQALGGVSVALRGADDVLAPALQALGARVLPCGRSAEGLSATLAQAVAQLPPGPVLVGLGDMPFVQPATLQALARRLAEGAEVVAPFFEGRRGNPVGFSAARRALLLTLEGDRGAGALLPALPLQRLEVADAGVLIDIDRPQDLEGGPPVARGG